ncbi:MAG: HD domain-containing protein [bacterium]|nr:HD domain-containing protein [bacterium]
MASLKELIDKLPALTKEEEDLVGKAYVFAEKVHKDNTRYSGDPYFFHPYETAVILAELGMGPLTISAGLLHDTLEDAHVSEKEIEEQFGKDILFLVQGVTKLGNLRYHGSNRHNESLRKLIVAMSQDLRVLIIKLADRLHNMKTIGHVPEDKQKRIAAETLEIYASLAYRLGMRKLSRELENLAFPYVYPKEYVEIKRLVKEKHLESIRHLEKFEKSIKKALAKADMRQIHVEHRLKSYYSLYRKLLKKAGDINKVYDILSLRIIVPTISDCYRVLGILHGMWRPLPGRIKDYIAFPKPNGYHSLHSTIFTGDGGIVEVQIKTPEMHQEAEYGIASHLSYKSNFKKRVTNPNLLWIGKLLPDKKVLDSKALGQSSGANRYSDVPRWIKELIEYQSQASHEEFLDHLKTDFFQERIFVFTPKGDVVDLPIGSTAVDFAYAIHSEIGNHIFGVKVNRKLVALDSVLHNGDIVEIITKTSSHPSRKWVDFAKTTQAKKHILSVLGETGGKSKNKNKNKKKTR